MASTKRLTEGDVKERLKGRPISLVSGTYLSIKKSAQWLCLSNPKHGIFTAAPRQIIHAGGGCPKCTKVSVITEDLVVERLEGRPIKYLTNTLNGSDSYAKWQCLSDETHPIWEATPSSVLNKKKPSGCPVCSGKIPLEESVIQSRLSLRNIQLVPGSYDAKTRFAKWLCLSNKEHLGWTATVNSVLYQNTGCPDCAGNTPITEEKIVKSLEGRPIELIKGTLNGSKNDARWKCLNDQSHPIWQTTPDSVINGNSSCPACSGHESLTIDVIKRKLVGRPIKLISNSEGTNARAVWGCRNDGAHRNWEATVGSVLAGSGCPECAGNARLNEEIINSRLLDRAIQIKEGTFVSSSEYATWKCYVGKNHPDWEAVVGSVLGGTGCPNCAEYGFKESKSAFIYILAIGDIENPIGLKCGITNNHPRYRQAQINKGTVQQLTLLKHWEHESGKFIRALEKDIMNKFTHNNLNGLLKDGGTETYFYKDLIEITLFIESKF